MGLFSNKPNPGTIGVDTQRIQQIINDSLNIMQKTKNIDTFLSRLNDCLTYSLKLGEKHKQNSLAQIVSVYPSALAQFSQNAIADIEKLKTPSARKTRFLGIANQLSLTTTGMAAIDSANSKAAEKFNELVDCL